MAFRPGASTCAGRSPASALPAGDAAPLAGRSGRSTAEGGASRSGTASGMQARQEGGAASRPVAGSNGASGLASRPSTMVQRNRFCRGISQASNPRISRVGSARKGLFAMPAVIDQVHVVHARTAVVMQERHDRQRSTWRTSVPSRHDRPQHRLDEIDAATGCRPATRNGQVAYRSRNARICADLFCQRA